MARRGLTHGDLSAYNLLVHDSRLVLIDLPQVVDVVGNPQGPEYLARDVHRIGEWFTARGLPRRSGSPRPCSRSCATRWECPGAPGRPTHRRPNGTGRAGAR
jgi:RIO kinase 1